MFVADALVPKTGSVWFSKMTLQNHCITNKLAESCLYSTNPFSGALAKDPRLLLGTELFRVATSITELLFKFAVAITLNAWMLGLQKTVLASGVLLAVR